MKRLCLLLLGMFHLCYGAQQVRTALPQPFEANYEHVAFSEIYADSYDELARQVWLREVRHVGGIDLREADKNGMTPLMWAAKLEKIEVVMETINLENYFKL